MGADRATNDDEIDERIEKWHNNMDIAIPLHEFLGWTASEYALWIEEGIIPQELA